MGEIIHYSRPEEKGQHCPQGIHVAGVWSRDGQGAGRQPHDMDERSLHGLSQSGKAHSQGLSKGCPWRLLKGLCFGPQRAERNCALLEASTGQSVKEVSLGRRSQPFP